MSERIWVSPRGWRKLGHDTSDTEIRMIPTRWHRHSPLYFWLHIAFVPVLEYLPGSNALTLSRLKVLLYGPVCHSRPSNL